MALRVLIVDDHTILRKGLRNILVQSPEIKTVDESPDGPGAVEAIQRKPFDVVILDISMPGQSGLETLKQIKAIKPGLPVLILSMHPEEEYAVRCIRAGASGYLTKESAPDQIMDAINRVIVGRKYITPALAECMAEDYAGNRTGFPHELLSDREFQIMLLLVKGMKIKEIASELSLSPKTISTYRGRIMEKMNLSSNTDLVRYVIENKIQT